MERQKLALLALVPVLAMVGLSACNRAAEQGQAQGSASTAPATQEESALLEPPEAAALTEQAMPAPAEPALPPPAPEVTFADVTRVRPVTESQRIRGTVTAVEDITKSSTTPQQICADVVVQERLPEKDGNTGGTVLGAVIGGVVGNQIGGGKGKTLATVGGAVAGGFIGNNVDKRSENGKVVSRTEQQCHTENVQSTTVVGYQVSYRNDDGSTGGKRLDSKPSIGSSINLGSTQKTVGYDVTYSYEGKQSTVRMDRRPGDQLQVIDGRVVLDSRPINNG